MTSKNSKHLSKSLKSSKKHLPKGKHSISIKYRLIAAFILFAILPLMIINILFYNMSSKALEDTSKQFTSQLVTQICTNVDYFLTEIEQRNLTVALDPRLNEMLNGYDKATSVEAAAYQRELQQKVVGMQATGGDSISNVNLLLNNGSYIGNADKITKEELLNCEKLDAEDKGVWIKGIGKDTEGLYYIRNVNYSNNSSSRRKIGTLVTRIKIEKLIKDIEKIEFLKGASFYILDQNNETIYNPDTLNKNIPDYVLNALNGEKMFDTYRVQQTMVTYATAKNGWKVIFELPEKALTSKLDRTKEVVLILIIITVILAVIFGIIVSQGFSKPIIKMMNLMKSAEQGDIKVKIEHHSNDEIGMLCQSFNNMMDHIRELIKETKAVMGETLQDSQVLEAATHQSVETSEQLALSIQGIASGAGSQAADAEKSTQTMYALSDSIQQVMSKTKKMVNENQDAKEIIQTATKSIGELKETMHSSIQTSELIKTAIIELSELTKNIEEIMKFIDRISEETNLLALNASIEAARAGAVGKGFAVVANEVRNLAEQSKRSTISVKDTLNTIRNKTGAAVKLVTKAHLVISSQEEVVNSTDIAFDNIINKLKNIDGELYEVSSEVSSMQGLKDAMISQIECMGAVTEETASTTEELSAFSEEQGAIINKLFGISKKLTTSMNELNGTMNTFKVE